MEGLRKVISFVIVVGFINSVYATEKNDKFHINGPTEPACVGKRILLEASGPVNGYEYYWHPSNEVETPFLKSTYYTPLETKTLFVVRVNTSNLNNRDTAYITIRINEKKATIYGPNIVCLGSSASLEIAPNLKNPTWSTGEKKHQIEITKPGIYSVEAHEGCFLVKGSHYVDSRTNPLSRIMSSRSTDLCAGDQVELRSFSSENPSWSNGSTSRSIVVKNQGTYTLKNTNECGVDKSEIDVTIFPIQADFIPSATELVVSEELDLFNHSEHGVRYEWYQDGFLISKDENASIRFQSEGTYSIELHAINEIGCRDVMTYPSIVVVNKSESAASNKQDLIFPNSFTPNGDGKNDQFQVYVGDISKLSVAIYNRWGQVIYEHNETSDLTWNGTDLMGNVLEQGQYILHYKYENKFGEPISNTSSINLLR